MDQPTAKKISTDYALLASGVEIKKDVKYLLIKTTESLYSEMVEEIVSSINKSLGESHSIMVKTFGDWT